MLILVRHGQSEANAAGLLVGRLDSPLTELGRFQARRIGETFVGGGGDDGAVRLLTSPLIRARDTAGIIAGVLGLDNAPEVDERLIELDYGVLDGVKHGEVPRATWAAWRGDPTWRPEGGESLVDLHARVEPLLDELRDVAGTGTVIVVTHVSPIKAAAAWALGGGPEMSWRMSLGVASITRIATVGRIPAGAATAGGVALVSFGEVGHLAAL